MFDLSAAIAEFIEAKKVLTQKVKENIQPHFKQIFDKYPDVEFFSYNAYTPYFNDGDECVYSVNAEASVQFKGQEEPYQIYDHPSYEGYKSDSPKNQELREVYNHISRVIDTIPNDIHKEIFGDHVLITVYPDRFETDSFDHD